jgi:putative CocE/NonD family hydrolase
LRIVDEFPHRVQEIENVWIPMPDGVRLAARVWLPADATTQPVPAILEWIPYRKRDGTRDRDETMHRWFAGHGYAAVRVDLRGTGDSDGILLDEYLEQEQDDAVEAIGWIASQPWCTGAVGMIGKSWGGFAALQVAARRPPALRAVITVCSSDDRYGCDAHYMGGRLLLENLAWGSLLMAIAAQPPDPAIVGESWRATWRARLDALQPFPEIWMQHPKRDAYWQHGSVCEDFSRIECPVFAVGGWADAYTDTVPRLLAGLRGPRRGLVGPWAHVYPHEGVPGPAIGFLQEAKRWWDRWLRDIDTGMDAEPSYRVWMPEGLPDKKGERPGRWVAEASWPSARIVGRDLIPQERSRLVFSDQAGAPRNDDAMHVPWETIGSDAAPWCRFDGEPNLYPNQRMDDARSLHFDSAPLEERIEILGAPELHATLAVDQPDAFVVVRLCDVAPDRHRVTCVTYGICDLRGRAASMQPVRIPLRHIAHAFLPGHRIRIAISTAYWPVVWPAPARARLVLRTGVSSLRLPVRPERAEDASLPPFLPPEGARTGEAVETGAAGVTLEEWRDPITDLHRLVTVDMNEDGTPAWQRFTDIDLEVGHGIVEKFSIRDDDPLSARAAIEHHTLRRRGDWEVRIRLAVRLRSTAQAYVFEADLEVSEGGQPSTTRQWRSLVPRS